MREFLTKGEVAELLGLSKSQIRFYEKKGLIHPQFDSNGYSMYTFSDLDILEIILVLKDLNMSIKEIKEVLDQSKPYDYEAFLRKSYEQVNNELRQLNEKRDNIKQRLKVYHQEKADGFGIVHYDQRLIYQVDLEQISTLKQVYDLIKRTHFSYTNYDHELYILKRKDHEIGGFFSISGKSYDVDLDKIYLGAGDYFSYTISLNIDDSTQHIEEVFLKEAQNRNLKLTGPLVFIDHFGKRFYSRHQGIYTVQSKIREKNI